MPFLSDKLASPGMPPSWAQTPNATTTCDLALSSFAIFTWSLLRMAPLMKLARMEPSGIRST
jgi:hypothetical protein